MKKFWRILIPVMVALVTIISFSGIALADDPTVVDFSWDGAGHVQGSVNSGDTVGSFETAGNAVVGSYSATDSNNNPYGYNVDNFEAVFSGTVADGFMDARTDRLETTPMYGPAGQQSWSFVGTDGAAAMAYRSTTNYAQMTDGTYGYQLPGGHNITVGGATGYIIDRGILDGRGNAGTIYATGDGSATLDCMTSGASGVWALQLGRGGGCFTDANFNATGTSGVFNVTGVGNNSVTFNGMGMSSGGGALGIVASWLNSFSIGDYSLTAN